MLINDDEDRFETGRSTDRDLERNRKETVGELILVTCASELSANAYRLVVDE